jgi:starch phosphorylase
LYVQLPDDWLRLGNPWQFTRGDVTVPVWFCGKIEWRAGRPVWIAGEEVFAMAHDVPIPGYKVC